LSVKCGLLTDKSAKIGSLSVNLSEILADCPKNKKYVPSRHVFLSLFSRVRGHGRSAPHLANRVSPHNPLVPSNLARARRAYPSQARLGYAGAERSAPHLANRVQTSNKAHDKFVPRRDCACADHSRPFLSTALLSGWSLHLALIRFQLAFPLSQARTP